MADSKTWAGRVEEWRASGLSSNAFCDGREFTAGALRYWAHKLEKPPREVPIARVVRTRNARSDEGRGAAASSGSALTLHIGHVRLAVGPGFDRQTLAALLDVLDARMRGAAAR